jgi:argininosuccinate lyase
MSGKGDGNVSETKGSIARTGATGEAMLPSLIAWSSSLTDDLTFFAEDVVGSAAHVTMLARTGLVAAEDARTIREALLALLSRPPGEAVDIDKGIEEDVHMAVEAALTRKLGPVAGRLHTARSRNDQVALDLRLYVRGAAAMTLRMLAELARELIDRAESEKDLVLAAYTHRQRAQPISGSFFVGAWVQAVLRAAETIEFALDRTNVLPLGSGACSGTSLPIDRPLVARLLAFPRVSENALDTVGDRDFALDWVWAGTRASLALSRIAADIIDFSTAEFGLVVLDGSIAAGSSMMPQKKNPDVFELLRGSAGDAIGDVTSLLSLVRGLPSGYNRDQQHDRRALLGVVPRVCGDANALRLTLPHVRFVKERCAAGLADGSTQATDLAEAVVRSGVPFREAYKAVGELVAIARTEGVPLASIGEVRAKSVHPAFTADALAALDPIRAVAAKESPGGTGPRAVAAQLANARARVAALLARAAAVPTIHTLARAIANEPLHG